MWLLHLVLQVLYLYNKVDKSMNRAYKARDTAMSKVSEKDRKKVYEKFNNARQAKRKELRQIEPQPPAELLQDENDINNVSTDLFS